MLLLQKGDLTAAIACYKSFQFKPNYPEALTSALLSQGRRPSAAIDAYNKALQFKPNYPDALNNLGTLKEQGDRAAIDAYKKALQLKLTTQMLTTT